MPTMSPKRIGFVSDHSGFEFKDKLINLFQSGNFKTVDYGCFSETNCDVMFPISLSRFKFFLKKI